MDKKEWLTPKVEILPLTNTYGCDPTKVGGYTDLDSGCQSFGGIPTS